MRRSKAVCRNRLSHFALAIALPLGACAGPIYLHSPSLEKATAKASTSLPDTATALRPFDDQLAALQAFAAREDLAVAQYWTTVRDGHFSQLNASTEAQRERALLRHVRSRLEALVGGQFNLQAAGDDAQRADLLRRLEEIAAFTVPARGGQAASDPTGFEAVIAVHRREFRDAVPGNNRDLSCESVLGSTTRSERERLARSRLAAESALGSIAQLCQRLASVPAFPAVGGSRIRSLLDEIARDTTAVEPPADPRISELEAVIARAVQFAKTDSSTANLIEFRASLARALANANQATKVAGLGQVSDRLEALQREVICGSNSVEAATKTAAGCGEATEGSSARAESLWAFAQALAQLADANAAERRSAEWLAAARAIVSAQRADAQISLERARAEVNVKRQQLAAMMREASNLAVAGLALLGSRAECHDGRDGGTNLPCALAAYLESWNEGRVAGQILAYRPIQLERADAVRRARVVAQREHVLAASGATMLANYGAGGLRAEEIAQAIFDLAVIGLIPGD